MGIPENEIQGISEKFARDVIPLDAPALVCLDLLEFGEHGDVVVFRAHHAITDGYGLTILVEDLVKLLFGVPTGKPPLTYSGYFRS